RRRNHEHLPPPPIGPAARLGELERIALAADVRRIAVDLVERTIARREAPEPGGTVGAGEDDQAARKLLQERRIRRAPAGALAPRRGDPRPQDRRLGDCRVERLPREPEREL